MALGGLMLVGNIRLFLALCLYSRHVYPRRVWGDCAQSRSRHREGRPAATR